MCELVWSSKAYTSVLSIYYISLPMLYSQNLKEKRAKQIERC